VGAWGKEKQELEGVSRKEERPMFLERQLSGKWEDRGEFILSKTR